MSQIEQFASQHNLLLRKDECRDFMIPGKLGHIYEHSASLLGVLFSESDRYTDRILLDRRRQLLKAGLILHQAGDAESIFLFDPTSAAQAQAVVRAVGARKKRRQTAGQLINLKKGPEKVPLQAPGNDAIVLDVSEGSTQHLKGAWSSEGA
jgi:hypothetical protein